MVRAQNGCHWRLLALISAYWWLLAAVDGGFLHTTYSWCGTMMNPKIYGHGEEKILAAIGTIGASPPATGDVGAQDNFKPPPSFFFF